MQAGSTLIRTWTGCAERKARPHAFTDVAEAVQIFDLFFFAHVIRPAEFHSGTLLLTVWTSERVTAPPESGRSQCEDVHARTVYTQSISESSHLPSLYAFERQWSVYASPLHCETAASLFFRSPGLLPAPPAPLLKLQTLTLGLIQNEATAQFPPLLHLSNTQFQSLIIHLLQCVKLRFVLYIHIIHRLGCVAVFNVSECSPLRSMCISTDESQYVYILFTLPWFLWLALHLSSPNT